MSGSLRLLCSEARLPIAADRVDVLESNLASLLTFHPDNPITETGVLSEFTHQGIRSRWARGART